MARSNKVFTSPAAIVLNSFQAMDPPTPQSLLLIIGSVFAIPSIGAFVYGRSNFIFNEEYNSEERVCKLPFTQKKIRQEKIGLALSGGGSRAIAFHLGCLRALNDRGLLDQINVISSVSGGSVIGALYAYTDCDFSEFENRVIKLLKSGFQMDILRRALFSRRLFESLFTTLISGSLAFITNIANIIGSTILKKGNKKYPRFHPPLRRWVNRTTAFTDVLKRDLFRNKKLTDNRRSNLEIVVNATELRTGSAFRFGSKETECWRFGRVKNKNIEVAQAVAASAAYPVLLPALDLEFDFLQRNGKESNERVILTDGGIYDNLGVTCLEPGRSAQFSSNIFNLDYIICCNAGPGLFSEDNYPYWWPSRMKRSFESVFRKAQDSAYGRLHNYVKTGELKGFILAYLGQQDKNLPYIPPDLIKRDEVIESLFAPYKGVNFPNIYDSYAPIIDFFIYTLLFVGVSQATLSKHFHSRGGKAVAAALGLVLAIGLVTSEKAIGFNLRSFGPIAAGILILLVGIMLFIGLKKTGITSIGAAAVALVLTYLVITTVIPGFAQWITSSPYTSWIHVLVIIAFAIAIYKLLKAFIPDKKKSLEKTLKKLSNDQSPEKTDLKDQIQQRKDEKDFIKKEMEKRSEQASQCSKDIIAELSNLRKLMGELGTPQSRYSILATLQSLPLQEQQIANALLPIKQKVKQLVNFDHQHFQQLRNDYPKLPSGERKLIKAEINEEWKKLDAESKIIKLENAGESYNRNFVQVIQYCPIMSAPSIAKYLPNKNFLTTETQSTQSFYKLIISW